MDRFRKSQQGYDYFDDEESDDEGEAWNDFIEGLEGISGAVRLGSPLLTKIKALEVLLVLIK